MELFYENQRFNSWWLKVLFVSPLFFLGYGILTGKVTADHKTGIYIGLSVLALVAILFYFTRLETRLDENGITIRFFPFQRVYYFVKWEEIESAYLRRYNPIWEYGGWGLRYSAVHGKAFTVWGTTGLQLSLKSGKKFMIGTQKSNELKAWLLRMKETGKADCITEIPAT